MNPIKKTITLASILAISAIGNYVNADLCDAAGGTILKNTTLNVPADYATIQDALFCLSGKTIEEGVIATIQVANGTYTNYDEILVDHADGDKINIIGNTTTPSSVTISFKTATNGLSVRYGGKLGLIDGFVFDGVDDTGTGINVSNGSYARTGSNMTIKRFSTGVKATIGATINCNGLESTDNGAQGFVASIGGVIYCPNSSATDNGSAGYWAERQGTIFASSCTSTGNLMGAYAQDKSYVQVESGTLTNNTNYGVRVLRFSYAHNGSATVSSNGTNYSPTPGTVGNQNSLITN